MAEVINWILAIGVVYGCIYTWADIKERLS